MPVKTRIVLGVALLAFLVVLARNAWASDDAFITLRTVYNFLHGDGLRWNGAERVQTFTHPLWLFVLIPFYVAIRDPFFTLYTAGMVVSLLAVYILLAKFFPQPWSIPLALAFVLSSKSFIDYSSSGLENPLSHLLALLFAGLLLQDTVPPSKRVFFLSLLAALSMLNRLDTLLLFLPALLLTIYETRKTIWQSGKWMALGFLPIILWEGFALFYYGFPFPNTYYAKLTTGIPQSDLYRQGWLYFQNSLAWDHVTLPTIGLAVLLSLFSREARRASLALGILLYLAYIVRIGGDFMSGRFFSTVFALSVALLGSLILSRRLASRAVPALMLAASALILLVGLTSTRPPLLVRAIGSKARMENGIADERTIYFKCCGLLNRWSRDWLPVVAQDALEDKQNATSIAFRESIGIYGFYAGPDVYLLDPLCLGDPLRARLPVTGDWRIGHFPRHVPAGYIETITNDFQNHIREPHLKEYYDKLLLVTRGDLFSAERLKTILEFNLGVYDPLLEAYVLSRDWEQ
jgi:arabinofuranosyltransferase